MNAESRTNTVDSLDTSSTDNIYVEAWEKTKGMKTVFWKAVVSIILAYIIARELSFTVAGLISGNLGPTFDIINNLLILTINIFLITPLIAGIFMLCIKNCTGLTASLRTLFQYFPYWKRLWMFPIIISAFSYVASLFTDQLIIQAIIYFCLFVWLTIYIMYIPLAIEQHYSINMLLEISRKTILEHWAQVLGFIVAGIVLFFFSLLTFGLAFIWTIPWFCNALAVFYRELFGIQISLV